MRQLFAVFKFSHLMAYFNKQIDLISQNKILSYYGVSLSITHLLTFLYWSSNSFFVHSQSSQNAEPVCLPFFPNCDHFRNLLSPAFWQIVLYVYGFFALVALYSFFKQKYKKPGYWLLLGLFFFKLTIVTSNYHLHAPIHTATTIVNALFLFSSAKQTLIRWFICFFLLINGLHKINIDWLSGSLLTQSPLIKGKLFEYSLYVIAGLELFIVWGLLFRVRAIRILSILCFLLFHTFSWYYLGFFTPLVMSCLLSLFVLKELKPFDKFIIKYKFRFSHLLIFLLIVISQLLPAILFKDPALYGTTTLLSLNMKRPKTECQQLLVAHRKKSSIHLNPPLSNLGVQFQCDPIVALNHAKQICDDNKGINDFETLSLSLISRRRTQEQFTKVLDIKNVCNLSYPLWSALREVQ